MWRNGDQSHLVVQKFFQKLIFKIYIPMTKKRKSPSKAKPTSKDSGVKQKTKTAPVKKQPVSSKKTTRKKRPLHPRKQ